MPAKSALGHKPRASAAARGRRSINGAFYKSRTLSASAADSGAVEVDFSIGNDPENLAIFQEALAAAEPAAKRAGAKPTQAPAKLLASAFERVAERFLRDAFRTEFDRLVAEYRALLRKNLVTGTDTQLTAALNRARLQERILSGIDMADQTQACELLGLSGSNPSATMKRKEDKHEIMRFTVDGRAAYPLLQFDVESRRIYPVMRRILAQKPAHWSDFRLLNWLTRPHLDLESTPSAAFGSDPEGVIAAFEREIEPEFHG